MGKLNPFFEVEGKRYEIMRTRALECEYDKIREQNKLDDESISLTNDYAKLMLEYEEIMEKYNDAKEEYFDDVLNKDKKAKYKAFKELSDEKFDELKNFELNNKGFSLSKVQKVAYDNGVQLLVYALCEQCNLERHTAVEIWDKFVAHFGQDIAQEWINAMIQTLFDSEEEENPFLKQARAKAQQKMEQRKGLSKVKK